ncbi:MAG: M16 family metallopeptidase [Hydrogenophaga sp.]
MTLLRNLLLAAPLLCMLGTAQAAIPIQHWTHPSGARVYLVESPAIPMLDVQLDFDGGSRRDPAMQAGLAGASAGLLTAGVAAQGGMPALDENQLAEAWADLGASFGAGASGERFSLSLRTLTQGDLLPRAVALAARQLAAPSWPDAIWQRDRQRMAAAWQEAQTRPTTRAGRAFSEALYGSHPLGLEATPQTWDRIDTAALRAFYRRHVAACRAHISLVGAIDRAAAERVVDQLLAAIAPHGCEPLTAVPEVQPLTAAIERRIPFDAAQAQVLVGQPGMRRGDPDYFPLFVGNYILGGGGFVSRLTSEVREKRGLSYSVYSYFAPGLQPGPFQIGLSTRPDQADQALAVTREVLQRFVADGPTEVELQAAKDNLINGFALRIDSNRKLLDNVANIAWNGLPLDYLDGWTAQVERVSVADIRRAFQRLLQPARMVTVVVGAP